MVLNGTKLPTTSVPAVDPGVQLFQNNSVTSFTYDTKGELLTITDPLNHVTTLTYYSTGMIHTITDAQSHVTTYAYDARGNRTSVTDANSQTTAFVYDSGDRLTTITYPDATTTTFGYLRNVLSRIAEHPGQPDRTPSPLEHRCRNHCRLPVTPPSQPLFVKTAIG